MRDVLVKSFIGIVIGITTMTFTLAQEVKVRGGFIEDGMKLGQNIHYWMSATYPTQLELILPDSNYNFSPFEIAGKSYYESQLKGDQIYDSAVYTLQSYEIDKVQYLALPAFIIDKGDTTTIQAQTDSILFFELVKEVTDTTQLKENLAYQEVHSVFNYPLYSIILVTLGVVSIVLLLIFGKKIRKAFKLRKLKKEHILFSKKLADYIQKLKVAPEWETAEHAISEWKFFLEKLEGKPYSTLTTKEIVALNYTQELKDNLKVIDRSIYGKMENSDLYKEFQAVEDFTQHRYSVITEEIKNG